jgi:hypothetical protein
MKKIIYDVKSEIREELDFSPEEIAEFQRKEEEAKLERLAKQQAEEEKQVKLESAKTKLAALGLTPEEISAITGA